MQQPVVLSRRQAAQAGREPALSSLSMLQRTYSRAGHLLLQVLDDVWIEGTSAAHVQLVDAAALWEVPLVYRARTTDCAVMRVIVATILTRCSDRAHGD
jgi:hypothetical protein